MDIPLDMDPAAVADLSGFTLRDFNMTMDRGVVSFQSSSTPTGTSAAASSSRSKVSIESQESRMKRRRKQRYTRSRTGCLTCRRRKVRCDEAHPICTRCSDLELDCAWKSQEPTSAMSEAPSEAPSEEKEDTSPTSPTGTDNAVDLSFLSAESAAVPDFEPTAAPDFSSIDLDFYNDMLVNMSPEQPQQQPPIPSITSVVGPITSTGSNARSLFPWVPAVAAPSSLSISTSALASRRAQVCPIPVTIPVITVPPSVTLEPFMHAFPSASARRLFHHYLTSTSTIVIAMGNKDDVSKNPFLAVSLPLISLNTQSPARAALRLSLLSVAAAHLHHLHPGSSNDNEMLIETQRAKRQATAKMVLSLIREGDVELDSVLATCVILMTRDVLSADPSWRENLEFAMRLIQKCGGPQAMLAEDASNFTRRFILEQLATHDVFGTFTTGQEPTLLGAWAPWWFDCEKNSKSSFQWESCERQFGVSRGMIDVVARCRIVAYRKARLGDDTDADPELENIADIIDREAWTLIDELRIWAISQQDSPRKARVQFGDHIYRHAMVVYLLCDVLGQESTEERVQTAVHCVLELCSEVSTEPVMLIWPLMIAGAAAMGDDRQWVRQLFDAFGFQYCYDLPAARRVLEEQWKRIDSGDGRVPWDVLMKDMDCSVLLI